MVLESKCECRTVAEPRFIVAVSERLRPPRRVRSNQLRLMGGIYELSSRVYVLHTTPRRCQCWPAEERATTHQSRRRRPRRSTLGSTSTSSSLSATLRQTTDYAKAQFVEVPKQQLCTLGGTFSAEMLTVTTWMEGVAAGGSWRRRRCREYRGSHTSRRSHASDYHAAR
jgi:hypothetical protein